jgi:uncharacterized protein YecA (UPF0149 family)
MQTGRSGLNQEELPTNSNEVQPGKNRKKGGRNDPCPCGSGKKYKIAMVQD